MTKLLMILAIVGSLVSCATRPPQSPHAPPSLPQGAPQAAERSLPPAAQEAVAPDAAPTGPSILRAKSRWTPVRWSELPGWDVDALNEAWKAWLKSCERPSTALAQLCPEVRRLSVGTSAQQRTWLVQRLQPYRVESLEGSSEGLLTSYYEPVLVASRVPTAGFAAPLYRPPATLATRKPWYSRQEMDTLPEAKTALQGRAIAYLADPVDALVLQIQGSGRLHITEPDGSVKTACVAYAGTNEQPYKSVGSWLLGQGLIKDASWPGIKAWIIANPKRVNELLWSNPRVVFFNEETLAKGRVSECPKGAQGVTLTAGRSIAVDVGSIPYGVPVWIASNGPTAQLQRLVMAQDTGSAILGAVRADYYAGSGAEAGELAGRLKQPLRLWVLWPRP